MLRAVAGGRGNGIWRVGAEMQSREYPNRAGTQGRRRHRGESSAGFADQLPALSEREIRFMVVLLRHAKFASGTAFLNWSTIAREGRDERRRPSRGHRRTWSDGASFRMRSGGADRADDRTCTGCMPTVMRLTGESLMGLTAATLTVSRVRGRTGIESTVGSLNNLLPRKNRFRVC